MAQILSGSATSTQETTRRPSGAGRSTPTVVQTANWSPDNSYFYGDVETNLLTSDSVIVRAALTCHGS